MINNYLFWLKYGMTKDHPVIKAANRTAKEELVSWLEFCLPHTGEILYIVEGPKTYNGELYDFTVVNLEKHFNSHNYAYTSFDEYMSWVSYYAPIKEWKQEGIFTNIKLKDEYIRSYNNGTVTFKYTPFWKRIKLLWN